MIPQIARFVAGKILSGRGSSTPDASSFTVRRLTNNIPTRANKLKREFDNLKRKGHHQFVKETPIDTGNARRSTKLKGNEIQANYDYSIKLEKQAHSRQAPRGMSEPTIDYLRKEIKKI